MNSLVVASQAPQVIICRQTSKPATSPPGPLGCATEFWEAWRLGFEERTFTGHSQAEAVGQLVMQDMRLVLPQAVNSGAGA